MIQDPNVERLIRKSIEPLNKQISMLQIELEGVKKQLAIPRVSQQRELLIAYEKNHYTPQEWALASKQCIEDIDNFLAINCG